MNLFDGIRVFVRVAQCSNFSMVAREFGMSQPNVSKQVAALEKHLGVRLFSRTTRRLRLTEEGIAYLGFAQKILDIASLRPTHRSGRPRAHRVARYASAVLMHSRAATWFHALANSSCDIRNCASKSSAAICLATWSNKAWTSPFVLAK
jgi:DNA-binding transcriptional LysR family regulator